MGKGGTKLIVKQKIKTSKKVIIVVMIIIFISIMTATAKVLAAKITSRKALIGGPNVGNTIYLGNGKNDGTISMQNENDHLYCIQHKAETTDAWYKVDAYVKIEGNKATGQIIKNNNKVTNNKNSMDNIVLAYLCGQEKYYKGYSNDNNSTNSFRMRAIHHFLSNAWFDSVGVSHLGINKDWKTSFNMENKYSNSDLKKEIKEFYTNATNEKKTSRVVPTISTKLSTSSITSNRADIIGPIKVVYSGEIESVRVKGPDEKNITKGIKFRQGGKDINAGQIASNKDFYIYNDLKTSGKEIKNITIKLKNNEVFTAELWFLKRADGNDTQRFVTVEAGKTTKEGPDISIPVTYKAKLNVEKYDKDTDEPLKVGFKVYNENNKKWLVNRKAPYDYSETKQGATVYYTYKGKRILDDLEPGTYHLYEVRVPSGYVLSAQDGYDKNNNWVDWGKVILSISNGLTKTVKKYNDGTIIKSVSISGYVWIDKESDTKESNFDSKYNEGNNETRVRDVKVQLWDKQKNELIEETYTDENGDYIFEELEKDNLKNYYVKFDYNGVEIVKSTTTIHDDEKDEDIIQETKEDISKYIPVEFNSKEKEKIVENGSRALADEIPYEDSKLSGIATTYMGTDEEKEKLYGLSADGNIYSKLYNAETETLTNINLGLKRIPDPHYNITESLQDIYVEMKGNRYHYIYGVEGETNLSNVPIVNGVKENARDIYPSDIAYGVINPTEQLKVRVVYRIDITNTTNTEIKDLYVEDKLYITNLINKFDVSRYELDDENWTAGEIQEEKDENGNVKYTQTATLKSEYLSKYYGQGIDNDRNNNSQSSLISFKIKHKALENLLNIDDNPNGTIEDEPTKAIADGYHLYHRDDYSWKNDIFKENVNHITGNDTRDATAPYLRLRLGEKRTITGTVFKDGKATDDGRVLGDGLYDKNNEKGVQDVKVEMLDVVDGKNISELPVSHLYYSKERKTDNNEEYEGNVVAEDSNEEYVANTEDTDDSELIKTKYAFAKDAIVFTDENGNYSLEGIVPGKYYLRFTYGDGTYKIIDPETNQEVEKDFTSKIENQNINAKDYKSTIVVDETVKTALENNKNELWYKEKKYENSSVAIDELNTKKDINEEKRKNVIAGTARVNVKIENTTEDETKIEVVDNVQKENIDKSIFGGFYFGIIEQPKQYTEIKKLITNVLLKDSDGRVLYDGNPENAQIQGVVAVSDLDLDNKNDGGSSNVKAEIFESLLHASNLTLTYEVRITNKSELNYYNKEYYLYGKANANKEVTLTPTEVYDYLDHTLEYVEKDSDSNRIKPAGEGNVIIKGENIIAKKYELNGWNPLYTSLNKNRKSDYTDKVKIVVNRQIDSKKKKDTEDSENNNDDEINIISGAKITKAMNTPDPSSGIDSDTYKNELNSDDLKVQIPANIENAEAKANFVITPPTGKDMNSIVMYAIAGVISLSILATGIIIIKKKIL